MHRVTDTTPLIEITEWLYEREPFRSSSGWFRGTVIDDSLVRKALWEHPTIKGHLTAMSLLALMVDEPDYVVWSGTAPIAWHATTRGITHRTDRSSYEWVIPDVDPSTVDDRTKRRINKLVRIVNAINEREPYRLYGND